MIKLELSDAEFDYDEDEGKVGNRSFPYPRCDNAYVAELMYRTRPRGTFDDPLPEEQEKDMNNLGYTRGASRYNSILTREKVIEARKMRLAGYEMKEIRAAIEPHMQIESIRNVIQGKTWGHVHDYLDELGYSKWKKD